MKTNNKKASRGFSLVELMVVVMIIGALAAIAMPQYDSYVARGRIAEGISLLSELQLIHACGIRAGTLSLRLLALSV